MAEPALVTLASEQLSKGALALPFFIAAGVMLLSLPLARFIANKIERSMNELLALLEARLGRQLTHPDANVKHLVSVASWAADAASIAVTVVGFLTALMLLVRDDQHGGDVWILLAALTPMILAGYFVIGSTPSGYRRSIPTNWQLVVVLVYAATGAGVLLLG